jgi:hypothetical protein
MAFPERLRRIVRALLTAVTAVMLLSPAAAQSGEKYSARLAWVPTGGAAARVTGRGAASATLSGRTLAIAGTFEGLGGQATLAKLHRGIAKGARGPAIADLVVTPGTSGTLSGSATLTAEQIEDLKQGRLYVQLHSDKGVAPDGSNLWGWFLR